MRSTNSARLVSFTSIKIGLVLEIVAAVEVSHRFQASD